MRDLSIKESEGFVVAFDITNKKSFQAVDYLISLIKAYHSSPMGVPCVLVGCKADVKKERKVLEEEA